MDATKKGYQVPRADLMQGALDHYEEAAKAAYHWNSVIPEAIRLWGADPKATIAALEAQLVAANERAEKAEREMVDWRGEAEAAVDAAIQLRPMTERAEAAERERDAARLERDELEVQCAAMREATEHLQTCLGAFLDRYEDRLAGEWPRQESDTWEDVMYLPHKALRTGIAALASTAGCDLLARLQRLENYYQAAERLRRVDLLMQADDTARHVPEMMAAVKAMDAARAAIVSASAMEAQK